MKNVLVILTMLFILTLPFATAQTGLASGLQPIPKSCRLILPSAPCPPPQTILTGRLLPRGRETFCCEPTGAIQPPKKTPPSTLKQSTTPTKTKLSGKTFWTPAGLLITGQVGLNQMCGFGKPSPNTPCDKGLICQCQPNKPCNCVKPTQPQQQTTCPSTFRELKQSPTAIQNALKGLPHIRQGWLTAVCQTKNEQHKIIPEKNTVCCYGTPCPQPPQDCALQTDIRCPTGKGRTTQKIGDCNYCCTPRPTIRPATPTQQQIVKDRVQQLIATGDLRVIGQSPIATPPQPAQTTQQPARSTTPSILHLLQVPRLTGRTIQPLTGNAAAARPAVRPRPVVPVVRPKPSEFKLPTELTLIPPTPQQLPPPQQPRQPSQSNDLPALPKFTIPDITQAEKTFETTLQRLDKQLNDLEPQLKTLATTIRQDLATSQQTADTILATIPSIPLQPLGAGQFAPPPPSPAKPPTGRELICGNKHCGPQPPNARCQTTRCGAGMPLLFLCPGERFNPRTHCPQQYTRGSTVTGRITGMAGIELPKTPELPRFELKTAGNNLALKTSGASKNLGPISEKSIKEAQTEAQKYNTEVTTTIENFQKAVDNTKQQIDTQLNKVLDETLGKTLRETLQKSDEILDKISDLDEKIANAKKADPKGKFTVNDQEVTQAEFIKQANEQKKQFEKQREEFIKSKGQNEDKIKTARKKTNEEINKAEKEKKKLDDELKKLREEANEKLKKLQEDLEKAKQALEKKRAVAVAAGTSK